MTATPSSVPGLISVLVARDSLPPLRAAASRDGVLGSQRHIEERMQRSMSSADCSL